MSCLVWNARGLGNPRAFHEFRQLLAGFSPSFAFVCETKLVSSECTWWRSVLGFEGMLVVDARGRKGGLMLLWNKEVDVTVLSYSQGHIDCYIALEGKKWRFTGFYGNPEVGKRKFSWELLRRLSDQMPSEDLPWLVGGDFNEIISNSEKNGGIGKPPGQMNNFREALYYSRLQEIAHPDKAFTWMNNREDDPIFERLDRFVGNRLWNFEFPNCSSKALDFFGSDHRPVLCRLESDDRLLVSFGKGRFHFEDKWFLEKDFVPDFLCKWASLHHVAEAGRKLQACSEFFENWAKSRFDKLGKKIAAMRKERGKMMKSLGGKSDGQKVFELTTKIEKAVEAEACHWKQRARVNWLANGDRNTGAFHQQASKRRKKNSIKALFNEDGVWVEEEMEKAAVIKEYFQKLFASNKPTTKDIEEVTAHIEERISGEDKGLLSRPYEAEEVRRAVFEMHPTKAPGPDGYNARFFQRFWPAVGGFITKEVLDALNGRKDLKEWNATLITLIPKVEKPSTVAEFRPLSLCNTLYKIVSKVLVNRLRLVLGRVIDQAQSAFLKGRQITDNVLISFECQHWLRNRKKGKIGYAALKLDMSKAYDRVEWDYLEAVLRKMEFPRDLCSLIMKCVRSVSFSFTLNRAVYSEITPTRGLRQGDPLSPFLFVVCAQGFSSLFNYHERREQISGVPVIPRALNITHLFFADDSLVFFRAKEEEAIVIQTIVRTYQRASGQLINMEKSSITFSPNTARENEGKVSRVLGVKSGDGIQRYLGLPAFSLRQKRLQFGYLVDRMEKKILRWGQREFSAGGKEVLIKSVAQAVPIYAMQCFRLPESICDDMHKICAGFWWGDGEEQRRMHWKRWEKMCLPKDCGGMGFRDLRVFNKALLAKQVWRILQRPDSLVARVFKERYFKEGDILSALIPARSSYVWRSLAWSRDLVQAGMAWSVGDGKLIRVLKDRWVLGMADPLEGRDGEDRNLLVADLMRENRAWDAEKIDGIFLPFVKDRILNTAIGERGETDERFWRFSPNGTFNVKSAYLLGLGYYEMPDHCSSEDRKRWGRLVWNTSIPPKVKIFMWRALSNVIPTSVNLKSHHVPTEGLCEQCYDQWGTTEHMLVFCPKVREIWKGTACWEAMKDARERPLMEIAEHLGRRMEKEEYDLWCIMLWRVWGYICSARHKKPEQREKPTETDCRAFLEAFVAAKPTYTVERWLGLKLGRKNWVPPPCGRYRVDVDARYDVDKGEFGAGAIIRDHEGKIIVAAAKKTSPATSVMMAEIMAVVHGIILCMEFEIAPVEIFTDSVLAARAMVNEEEENRCLPDDIKDILDRAREIFLLSVKHVFREANEAAHALAKFAGRNDESTVWTGFFPCWLRDLVASDFD